MVYEEEYFERKELREYADTLVEQGLGTSVRGEDNKTFSFTHPEFTELEIVVQAVDLCFLGSARPLQTILRGDEKQVKRFIEMAKRN